MSLQLSGSCDVGNTVCMKCLQALQVCLKPYPHKHVVSMVVFAWSALPVVCDGVRITQKRQVFQKIRVLRMKVRPRTGNLYTVQLFVSACCKFCIQQLR